VTIVEIAVDVCIDGWQITVAERGVDALGEKLWNTIEKRNRKGCDQLAAAARHLLEVKAATRDLVGKAAARLYSLATPTSPEDQAGWRFIQLETVRATASKIPLPTDQVLEQTARALRIIGIYLCTVNDNLDHCECLIDLARDTAEDQLKQNLTSGLEKWSADST
jgi:hypothetical protein